MNEMIFSWAEAANGKIVHVDSVRQGLNCGCTCPCCHEQLQARHGEVRAHGFAHHSEKRGANLKICYMVIMYKLAEQIILEQKKIHAPSYYGIFKERDLEFSKIIIDDRYDRTDKQPDVIAETADGQQYLIEFTFAYKVQHKEKIDYKEFNCLEIDLSSQTLETLQDFLLHSNEHRKWLNNQADFERIESAYSQQNKSVKVRNETECLDCLIKDSCCGIRHKGQSNLIIIENSGHTYRVCKTKEYANLIKQAEELQEQESKERELFQRKELERQGIIRVEETTSIYAEGQSELIETSKTTPELRTCFMCERNLDWRCNDGYAHCGPFRSFEVPPNTPPNTAKACQGFRIKSKK